MSSNADILLPFLMIHRKSTSDDGLSIYPTSSCFCTALVTDRQCGVKEHDLQQPGSAEMTGDTAFNVTKMWNFTGYVFAQLSFPSLSVLIDTFAVPHCKGIGFDTPVRCLRSENCRGLHSIHLCLFKQEQQIEQVAALETLEHAAQFLASDLG